MTKNGRFFLLLFLMLAMSAGTALAQTYGKIEGAVRNQDTGAPMGGVQVLIEGTRLGNVTNEDGYYFILNVPVGLRTVVFSFTGFKPVNVVDVRVTAGNTITVDAGMSVQVVGLEAIVIEGEAAPLMTRDNVQTRQNLESDAINNTPATALEDLLVLQAGVVVDYSGNYSLRGGREGEEALYVDGILAKAQNELQGQEYRGVVDDDLAGEINPLVVAGNAMEEVSVITGGFQAEFGNAQSGLINIVTKEGGTELAGRLQFMTDQVMPRNMDYGFNHLEGSIGGPVFSDKLTFFATGMIRGMADAFPRLSGDKGGFRGISQKFIDGLNRDLGSIGVVKDGIADRSDAIDPLTVNSFANYSTITTSPQLGYGEVNTDGTVSRGFTRSDGLDFRYLAQNMVIADPADVNADGVLRSGAQPLIQIDPTTGNLFTMVDGSASSSQDDLAAAFASGVAVPNPDYPGAWSTSNPARLPGNWKDVYAASFKTVFAPLKSVKLLTAYHRSRIQRQFFDHAYVFNTPERFNIARRWTTDLGLVGMDWKLFQSSRRSLNLQARLSYFKNDLDGGLPFRLHVVDRNTFMGVGGNIGFYNEDETDRYMLYSAKSSQGFANDLLEPEWIHADLDRSYDWPTEESTPNNIFGSKVPSRVGERSDRFYFRHFISSGVTSALTDDKEKRWAFKLDMDSQLDRYNRIKFGFETLRWNVNETARIYHGEVFDDEYTAEPRLYSFYGQDRLDFGDLVIDLGLRYDRFNTNKEVALILGQNTHDDINDDETIKPDPVSHWSPRISVAHPVTDRTQVRLSYGHFYQIPAFEMVYTQSERDFMTDAGNNPNVIQGNSLLDMSQTIQFEAGITALLSEDLVMDFVGYNREILGNFGYRLTKTDDLRAMALVDPDFVVRAEATMRVPANQDYGNVRGFDLTFDKRYSQYLGVRGTYSLMFARSTQSDPREYVSTLARQLDPFTGESPPPPNDLAPTDNDRAHQVSLMFNFRFPSDFQEGTTVGKVFGDFAANLNIRYASGVPYTPVDQGGNFITTSNSARTPDFKLADLRLSKSFRLGGNRVTVFANIMNLFENVNYGQQAIDPTSGQVGIDKFSIEEVIPSATPVAQITAEDMLIRDFNKDGEITRSEAAAAQFARSSAQDLDPRFWLRPREVRLGVEYSF